MNSPSNATPQWTPPRSMRARAVAAAVTLCCAGGAFLSPYEGRVLHTYPDAVYGWKLPTACDGHTGPELHQGQTFTPAECDQMRTADLRKTYDQLAPCFGDAPMSDHEVEAYLSVGYNLGTGTVCRSSIPRKVKAGQHLAACDTITEFVYAGSKDCRLTASNCGGIVRRRGAERALCVSQLPAKGTP